MIYVTSVFYFYSMITEYQMHKQKILFYEMMPSSPEADRLKLQKNYFVINHSFGVFKMMWDRLQIPDTHFFFQSCPHSPSSKVGQKYMLIAISNGSVMKFERGCYCVSEQAHSICIFFKIQSIIPFIGDSAKTDKFCILKYNHQFFLFCIIPSFPNKNGKKKKKSEAITAFALCHHLRI